jgi:hypothetical protein
MNRLLVSAPLFVGLLGLSACSSEEAIPSDIKVDPIEWSTCDDYPEDETLECGVLEVPLDYSDLEGETIEISLIRIPAISSKPKGVVLSNPGGPGESGVNFVSSWSVEFVINKTTSLSILITRPMMIGSRSCTTNGWQLRSHAPRSSGRLFVSTQPRTPHEIWI